MYGQYNETNTTLLVSFAKDKFSLPKKSSADISETLSESSLLIKPRLLKAVSFNTNEAAISLHL